jgi:hypothetical protein
MERGFRVHGPRREVVEPFESDKEEAVSILGVGARADISSKWSKFRKVEFRHHVNVCVPNSKAKVSQEFLKNVHEKAGHIF